MIARLLVVSTQHQVNAYSPINHILIEVTKQVRNNTKTQLAHDLETGFEIIISLTLCNYRPHFLFFFKNIGRKIMLSVFVIFCCILSSLFLLQLAYMNHPEINVDYFSRINKHNW
jgi:hypothetical protein